MYVCNKCLVPFHQMFKHVLLAVLRRRTGHQESRVYRLERPYHWYMSRAVHLTNGTLPTRSAPKKVVSLQQLYRLIALRLKQLAVHSHLAPQGAAAHLMVAI